MLMGGEDWRGNPSCRGILEIGDLAGGEDWGRGESGLLGFAPMMYLTGEGVRHRIRLAGLLLYLRPERRLTGLRLGGVGGRGRDELADCDDGDFPELLES